MTPKPSDRYEQYADVSSMPICDVFVGLVLVVTIFAGGLAAIYAVGYFLTDHADSAWPLVGTFVALIAANVAIRAVRVVLRRRAG